MTELHAFLLGKISHQRAHAVKFKAQPDLAAHRPLPLTGPPEEASDRTSGRFRPLNSEHICPFRLETFKINSIISLLTHSYIYFLLLYSHSLYFKYILYICIHILTNISKFTLQIYMYIYILYI